MHRFALTCAVLLASSPALAGKSAPDPVSLEWEPVTTTESPDTYPTVVEYDPHVPPPQGYELRTRPRYGMLATGLVTWGLGWAMAGIAATADESIAAIPLLGPPMAYRRCKDDYRDGCGAYAFFGAVELLGATVTIASVSAPRKELVRRDEKHLRLAPVKMGRGQGVAFIGRF